MAWAKNTVLSPRLPYPDEFAATYVVRTQPGQRDALMRSVEEHLQSSNPDRMIEWARTLEFFWNRTYRADLDMEIFLIAVTLMLLAITCLGIYGLATFNVANRIKQIGIRRALGATRADIASYFLKENGLITSLGAIVGCGLSLTVSNWLSRHYALPRLDLYYLVGGIPALWIIGQLAAWNPARRASAVSPATATRSV